MTDRPHPDLDAPLTAAEADEMRRVRTLDLDEIEQRYTPKDPGPCRVCGEPLSISSFGPAGVTWACNYLSDEQEADGRCKIKPGRGGREETRPGGHYSESRVIQYGRTDSEVTALVAEVRRLRAAQEAALAWARDRGYLEPDYADEDYPCDELWTAMIDALRALAGGTDTSDAR